MNRNQKENLRRLLTPRHIAFIGGESAVFAAQQCQSGGFKGEIWGVNPKPGRFDSLPCYPSVSDLPEGPDATFLAVPRKAVPRVLTELREKGSGGIVCYSAGFGELGSDGEQLEKSLIAACGDMALAGPNVFGLLNYVTNGHLWPFSHGGQSVKRGPAIISQSGMLSSYLLTNRRSVRFSYVIGAGNQSVLGVEDYLEHLVDNPAVNGFGLYIETLRDIPRFTEAANRALEKGIPIVALKVGKSDLAAKTALTHTGSLAGVDHYYQALFDRVGIARVSSPSLMLETLNMLTVAGGPSGNRLAAFTCSGGDVAMLADCADEAGLHFPEPDALTRSRLTECLPDIATVGNPLDYTTPLWGQEEKLESVFDAALEQGYDAALLVQDYPPVELGSDRPYYQADAMAFIRATRRAGIPAAICASLPENLDNETQQTLTENQIAPLQGISEATTAIAAAAVFGRARQRYLDGKKNLTLSCNRSDRTPTQVLDEWQGKSLLKKFNIPIPNGILSDSIHVGRDGTKIGFPVVLKLVNAQLPHKTEHGIVRLNLQNEADLKLAAQDVISNGAKALGTPVEGQILVEEMVTDTIAELLVGIKNDPQFGLIMTIASGGTLVELLNDARTLLLPADRGEISNALSSLKVMKLLTGYRGRPMADIELILDCLEAVSLMAQSLADSLSEMDINPLLITADRCVAADALVALFKPNSDKST